VVEVYWRRGVSMLLSVSTLLTAVGALYVVAISRGHFAAVAAGIVAALISGWASVVLAGRAREKRPVIRFTADGLSDPTNALGVGDVTWGEVSNIETRQRPIALPIGRIHIVVRSSDPASLRATPLRRAKAFATVGSTSPGTINLSQLAVKIPRDLRRQLEGIAPVDGPTIR
jgi:hypothetical protein